ncbi:MAG: outer membrane protein OmpK [Arsenophonus endosymbiont of Dermacentor nuttalli]
MVFGHELAIKYGGNFHEINTLYGIGYNFSLGNLRLKPFLALHYVDQTFYSGMVTLATSLVGSQAITSNCGHKILLSPNWHEMEFNRTKRYVNGGREGVNGAIALWWMPFATLSAGIQYHYADNKLGDSFYHDGIIYTIKYNF